MTFYPTIIIDLRIFGHFLWCVNSMNRRPRRPIYIYIYIYIYPPRTCQGRACIQPSLYVEICTNVYKMYVCARVFVFVCECVCVCVCACVYRSCKRTRSSRTCAKRWNISTTELRLESLRQRQVSIVLCMKLSLTWENIILHYNWLEARVLAPAPLFSKVFYMKLLFT